MGNRQTNQRSRRRPMQKPQVIRVNTKKALTKIAQAKPY